MEAQAEKELAMMLGLLRPLYSDFGRWASVYLDTSRRSPVAADAVRLHWRDARDQLAAAGADAATLAALQDALDGQLGAPGRALFARDGQVVSTPALRTSPATARAEFGPLPAVMPFLTQYLPPMPRLQVSADREGGEVLGIDAEAASVPPEQRAAAGQAEHAGGIQPVHKAHPGGLERPRRESSIEQNWDDNAKELASRVQEVASRVKAEYVLLAGDVKARGLLLRHLPPALADNVVLVDAEIGADSPELGAVAEATVAERVARKDTERFGEWHRLRAHGLAVEGLPSVVAALRDGLVAELFLPRQPQDGASAWTGPAATDIALSASELRERGVAEPVHVPVSDAIVRAVVGTDAEVRFLPAATAQRMPADHTCATLRAAGQV
jgi:hypothetical protein